MLTSALEPRFAGISLVTWVKVLVLGALLALTFRYSLVRLYLKTNPFTGEANWGHSFFVPVIGFYYLYLNRDELLSKVIRPVLPGRRSRPVLMASLLPLVLGVAACIYGKWIGPSTRVFLIGEALGSIGLLSLLLNWGLGTLIFGLLCFGYGIWPGQNDFIKDLGGVITLFGLVLLLCGWDIMRLAWFPISFLVCAIPWPGLVYSWVASPLQQLAASVAVGGLNVLGVESYRGGTKIYISIGEFHQFKALNVAEACAGMRSLMTFISVAIAVAFLSNRPLWQRIIVGLSAIPIAIFCNVMRVTGTGILYRYYGPEWAEGFTHQFVGLVMLVPAFFMILGVCWILDHLFVEELDHRGSPVRKVLRRGGGSGQGAGASTGSTPASPRVARDPGSPRRPLRRAADGGAI